MLRSLITWTRRAVEGLQERRNRNRDVDPRLAPRPPTIPITDASQLKSLKDPFEVLWLAVSSHDAELRLAATDWLGASYNTEWALFELEEGRTDPLPSPEVVARAKEHRRRLLDERWALSKSADRARAERSSGEATTSRVSDAPSTSRRRAHTGSNLQTLMNRILGSGSDELRQVAAKTVCRMDDQESIATIATEAPGPAERRLAVQHLRDRNLVGLVRDTDPSTEVRKEAEARQNELEAACVRDVSTSTSQSLGHGLGREWFVLTKGEAKEGPFSLGEVRDWCARRDSQAGLRIRKGTGAGSWVSWAEAGDAYPELVDAGLVPARARSKSNAKRGVRMVTIDARPADIRREEELIVSEARAGKPMSAKAERLLRELMEIRDLYPDGARSPRARAIGEQLHRLSGDGSTRVMKAAFVRFRNHRGGTDASLLSGCWSGIGMPGDPGRTAWVD